MDPRRAELEARVARLREAEHAARTRKRGRRFERVDAELADIRRALEAAERELRERRGLKPDRPRAE